MKPNPIVVETHARLAQAVAAFTSGPGAGSENLTQRVARSFGAAYLRQLGRSLTLPEVSTLMQAERVREAGLVQARSGDLSAAAQFIAQARSTTEDAGLTGEAMWAAESFQLAAESYLHYRQGLHGEARADLYGSIALSVRLGSDRGYSMDYRVIHLARNVVRVENVLGSKRVAFSEAKSLALFISGDEAAWPFTAQAPWERLPELDDDERLLACDDVMGEFSVAMEMERDNLPELAAAELQSMDPVLRTWLVAIYDYRRGDPARFLDFVVEHCTTCRVAMPQVRQAIETRLTDLCVQEGCTDLPNALRRNT